MILRIIILGILTFHQNQLVTYGQCAEPNRSAQPLTKRPGVRFTISKETTNITAPLSKDGYVDYAKALDQLARNGVAAEDNAAIPLIMAYGKKHIWKDVRAEYVRRIGLARAKLPMPHFIQMPQWHQDEELHERLSNATSNLWDRAQYPRVAKWISTNEQPLRLVTQASQRSKFYSPIITSEFEMEMGKINPGLIGAYEPFLSVHREADRALLARAMLRLNAGRLDYSWKDLIAAHRLTRLAGQHPTVISALWSLNRESNVCVAERTFLLRAELSCKQLCRVMTDLDSLPPMLALAEKYDRAGRWSYLDAVRRIATDGLITMGLLNDITHIPRKRVSDFEIINVSYQENAAKNPNADFVLNYVNWNYVLRDGNRWYDRIVSALSKAAGPERRKIVRALANDHKRIRVLVDFDRSDLHVAKWLDLLDGVVATTQMQPAMVIYALWHRPHTRRYATLQLNYAIHSLVMGSFSELMDADDRTKTQFRLTQLTAALSFYRKMHGVYPPNLSKLTGPHIKNISQDVYSGRQFGYRTTGRHFELSSKGSEPKHNGDRKNDDLVVRSKQKE